MNFEYVNEYYGVNSCFGRRVVAYGEPGTVVPVSVLRETLAAADITLVVGGEDADC